MDYCLNKDIWKGLNPYSLNGPISTQSVKEKYGGPVTLPLDEWREYVASGKNTLYGSGGVIPGGTMSTPFGGGGAVYAGTVRQGIGY
jgi:hypothetical protein